MRGMVADNARPAFMSSCRISAAPKPTGTSHAYCLGGEHKLISIFKISR
jgi:hypothetical protein